MKVCTDACLFGAWVAGKINDTIHPKKILDIGTGTGLLALMLAQKTIATIDAIEIDASAASQATCNIAASDWHEKVTVHHTALQSFVSDHQYDLIISNPPFYQNDLKSPSPTKNIAWHSEALSFDTLLLYSKKFIKPQGKLAVLLPVSRVEDFIVSATGYHFYAAEKMWVRQTEKHKPFRCMLMFSLQESNCLECEITIKHGMHYTLEFTDYLKDYYLHV